MENIVLTQMSVDELKSIISEIVSEEFKKIHPPAEEKQFITRKETAAILRISLPTLTEWCKEGKVPAYKIGSRVRFVKKEIEQLTIYKYQ